MLSWNPDRDKGRKLSDNDREDFINAADHRAWDELEKMVERVKTVAPMRTFLVSVAIVWLRHADAKRRLRNQE